ncbi:hypothetical protein [Virgibacillus litoralis]|uniref:Uncharacterized protein n=1 Tax=Virgibacillus litoralis TaxID=578221 RepID=A0ABS4HHE1_9BACI|nr:hypothetical protein [Virgibacillus litoralis]MBP1950258.1 hypothetical protein [Virgibacillus litoralis]
MLVPFRVLLPKWVYDKAENQQEIHNKALEYMQRYPHYTVTNIKNGFAICERIELKK